MVNVADAIIGVQLNAQVAFQWKFSVVPQVRIIGKIFAGHFVRYADFSVLF